MNTNDFYFDLPTDLIAQFPLAKRSDSRLLRYNRHQKSYDHQLFSALPTLLEPGDLLVMNNSRVIPARFYGQKETGGKVEFLLERLQNDHLFLAHIKASKVPRAGMIIYLHNHWQVKIIAKHDDLYVCEILGNIKQMLQEIGHIPLPLYINRADNLVDRERYQTVYSQHDGSVAAPTAGLHFDEDLLVKLARREIKTAFVTLHVGAGTFKPVRCQEIGTHKMHAEYCIVDEALCQIVNETKALGHRVIAVGTTTVRSLESAAKDGILQPFEGDTDIFIYPGYQFKICSGLITNFHLPKSTLLMLVAAFIGHQETLNLYQEAIYKRYRFYSYGDASLLL
jgi:S-adenosylmethionine:tRNA ribosyltransferase-isomerase